MLGDIMAGWAVFVLGITILGSTLLASFVFDFALALLLGMMFQYFAIGPIRA